MKALADWLRTIEHTACTVYKEASHYFRENPRLQQFLKYLSNDEAWHYHLMGSASDYYATNSVRADILLDDETKQTIEGLLDEFNRHISDRTLTEKRALQLVAELEFSEWNDIFLYVVQDLTNRSYEFSFGTSKIQQHMKFIEGHLSSYEQYPALRDVFQAILPAWEKRLLLVEDTETLVTFLGSVLKKEGLVEIARNGEEAIQMIKHTSFDLILSDIHMPVMDGVSLFKLVESTKPDLINCFIFHTSDPSDEVQAISRKYDIPLLIKPSRLTLIRQVVRNVLSRSSAEKAVGED